MRGRADSLLSALEESYQDLKLACDMGFIQRRLQTAVLVRLGGCPRCYG